MSEEVKCRLAGVFALTVISAMFMAVAALPALLPVAGLLLSADYLPSACLALVGAFQFVIMPWIAPRRR